MKIFLSDFGRSNLFMYFSDGYIRLMLNKIMLCYVVLCYDLGNIFQNVNDTID